MTKAYISYREGSVPIASIKGEANLGLPHHEQVHLPIAESRLQGFHVAKVSMVDANVVGGNALGSQQLLFRREPPGGVRPIRENKSADDSHAHGHRTLDLLFVPLSAYNKQ